MNEEQNQSNSDIWLHAMVLLSIVSVIIAVAIERSFPQLNLQIVGAIVSIDWRMVGTFLLGVVFVAIYAFMIWAYEIDTSSSGSTLLILIAIYTFVIVLVVFELLS